MIDSKENRLASLAISETDKTTLTTNTLVINVETAVPIIYGEKSFMDSVEYNNLTTLPALPVVVTNTLVDIDYLINNGVDRFIYISKVQSMISKSIVRLYYDNKYNDIIIIPDTINFGLSTAGKIDPVVNNQEFYVKGYVIGNNNNNLNDVIYQGSSSSVSNTSGNIKLPITKENVTNIKHALYLLNGLNTASSKDILITTLSLDADTRFRNKANIPAQFINLGVASGLFSAVKPIPMYNIIQNDINHFSIQHLGIKQPADTHYLLAMFNF